ncbi:MAG: hypothetical protein ACJ789_00075 [Thermomicrobiales bacterium]
MFERENAIGVLLLGLCTFMGGVLVYSIVTGTQLEYTGPSWLAVVIAVLFIGAVLYGLRFGMRGRRGSTGHWPDPMTGQKGRRDQPERDDSTGPDAQP